MTVVAIPRGVRPAALSGGAAYSSHPVGAFLVFCARFLWLPIPSSAFYSGFLRLNQEKVFSESTFGSGWDCQGEKRRWQEVDVGKSSGGVPWDEVHRDDVNCMHPGEKGAGFTHRRPPLPSCRGRRARGEGGRWLARWG